MEREQWRGRCHIHLQETAGDVTYTSKPLRLVLENTHACGLAEAHLTALCESGKVMHHYKRDCVTTAARAEVLTRACASESPASLFLASAHTWSESRSTYVDP